MRKFLILAVALMGLVASANTADAQLTRKVKALDPVKWVKGATSGDSIYVNVLFVAATNGSDPDTTVGLDIGPYKFPQKMAATDSTVVLTANVHWGAPSSAASGLPTVSELTTDTTRVTVQYSADGNAWTTQQVVQILGASNNQVATIRLTNRVAAMDAPIRFVRWILQNYDQSADAGTSGHSFWIQPAIVVVE